MYLDHPMVCSVSTSCHNMENGKPSRKKYFYLLMISSVPKTSMYSFRDKQAIAEFSLPRNVPISSAHTKFSTSRYHFFIQLSRYRKKIPKGNILHSRQHRTDYGKTLHLTSLHYESNQVSYWLPVIWPCGPCDLVYVFIVNLSC